LRAELLRRLAVPLVLAASLFAIYGQVWSHRFLNFDDDVYVADNALVRSGLTAQGAAWAFRTTLGGHWHPLTWLSLMLDAQLYGPRAGAFLMTNVALHAANATILYLILLWLTGKAGRSGLVAALFALHPLRVESVAWAVERKDVLSTLFLLLALAAYCRWARGGGRRWYAAALAAVACGLLTKPMLVTAPALLLLVDFWPLQRPWRSRLLIEKLPFAALAAASSAATVIAQSRAGAIVSGDAIPAAQRFANAAVAYVAYVGKALWPAGLAVFYPYEPANAAAAALAALSLVAATAAALGWREKPYLSFGWLWYLVTLVPVVGFVQVGGQAMADRFTYVPLIGLSIAAVWAAADLTAGRPAWRTAAVGAAGLALAGCAALSWRQVGYWRDSATLFAHALDVTRGNFLAHTNLGSALEREGRLAEARAHYAEAVRLNPGYPEAQNNAGTARAAEGDFAAAETHFRAALRGRPDFTVARFNLALALDRQERPEALAHFATAVAAEPERADWRYSFADALARDGRLDDAAREWLAVVRLQPRWGQAQARLAATLASGGRLAEAEGHYREAVRLDPADAAALYGLANLLTRAGRLEDAVANYGRALALRPGWAEAHHHLGVALAAQGRLDDAIARYADAIRLKPELPDAHYNLALALASRGRMRDAAASLRVALRYQPAWTQPALQLAWLLATDADPAVRNGAEAVSLAERATAESAGGPLLVDALEALAAAYAETRRFGEAATTAVRAAQAARSRGEPQRAEAILERSRRYASGQPFRLRMRS
jgi:tetratricopeptide (TPR) repeat protein